MFTTGCIVSGCSDVMKVPSLLLLPLPPALPPLVLLLLLVVALLLLSGTAARSGMGQYFKGDSCG